MSEPSLSRRAFLVSTGLAALAAPSLTGSRAAWAAAAAKVGAAAPAFSPRQTGRPVSLANAAGKGGVLDGEP